MPEEQIIFSESYLIINKNLKITAMTIALEVAALITIILLPLFAPQRSVK
jgi:hypothetical protein